MRSIHTDIRHCRMASNNLAHGAKALLAGGADPMGLSLDQVASASGETPLNVARGSHAFQVAEVIEGFGTERKLTSTTRIGRIDVLAAGESSVVGSFYPQSGSDVPKMFASVCEQNGWKATDTWRRLNGGHSGIWYAHESDNGSYMYFNRNDRLWWIDGPDGLGVFTAPGVNILPCASVHWRCLQGDACTLPTLGVFRNVSTQRSEL